MFMLNSATGDIFYVHLSRSYNLDIFKVLSATIYHQTYDQRSILIIKMKGHLLICVLLLCLLTDNNVMCATFQQVRTEYEKLLNAYTIDANNSVYYNVIPPRQDDSQPVVVTMGMSLFSILGYDAVEGTMDIVGSVTFKWRDDVAITNGLTFDATAVPTFMIDSSIVWVPVIVMENSANSIERLGDTVKVRYNLNTREMTWKPRVLLTSSCSPDVSKFPFDTQTCEFIFTSWFHDKFTVQLEVDQNKWDLENFSPDGVWTLGPTKAEAYVNGNYYYTKFTVEITRQSLYFTLNVVCPILLLSVLSGFVFLLPPASGERMGFGMTCFLTFVVLLQTMMNFLPEASKPMSMLCYYVILMMMFTAFLSIVTVVLLKVHNIQEEGEDPEPVPDWLISFIEFIKCVKCKRRCRKVNDNDKHGFGRNSKNQFADIVEPLPDKIPFSSESINGESVYYNGSEMTKLKQVATIPDEYQPPEDRRGLRSVLSVSDFELTEGMMTPRYDINGGEINGGFMFDGDTDSRLEEWVIEAKQSQEEDIDWETVGKILDMFFLAVFVGIQILLVVIFIFPIAF